MLNEEILKWGCELAEGFSYEIIQGMEAIVYPYDMGFDFLDRFNINNDSIEYDSFLNRVIEGINKDTDFMITQHWDVIEIEDANFNSLDTIGNECDGHIDQAKEQAIKYIHNKMVNK